MASRSGYNPAVSGGTDNGATTEPLSRVISPRLVRVWVTRVSTYDPKEADEVEGFQLIASLGPNQNNRTSNTNRRSDGLPGGGSRLLEIEGASLPEVFDRLAEFVRANEERVLSLAETPVGERPGDSRSE